MIWGASRWIAIRFPSVAWLVWRRRLWSFCNVMGGLRKSRALLELIWFFLRVLYCSSIFPCTMIETRNSYTHLWFTSHTGHGMVIKPNLMGLQIHEKDFYSQRNNRGWSQSTNSSMAQSPVNNATWQYDFSTKSGMHFFQYMNMSYYVTSRHRPGWLAFGWKTCK